MLGKDVKFVIEMYYIGCPDKWSFEESFSAVCKLVFSEMKNDFLDTTKNRELIYSHMDSICELV